MTSSVVEELHLIQCSLLPGESLTLIDDIDAWNRILEDLTSSGSYAHSGLPSDPLHFQVRVEDTGVWFDVTITGSMYTALGVDTGATVMAKGSEQLAVNLQHLHDAILVKGDYLSRDEQIRWQEIVKEKVGEVVNSEAQYPIYELLSSHLLPLLHNDAKTKVTSVALASSSTTTPVSQPHEMYHALFTSHHLISPTKRRSLQSWSHSLSIQGFSKVGYPGVIYAQGEKENVEEFVGNVKAMQWLALRLRFTEPLPENYSDPQERQRNGHEGLEGWRELEKVGEVVEVMRRIGREEYVVEMGIGSAGTT